MRLSQRLFIATAALAALASSTAARAECEIDPSRAAETARRHAPVFVQSEEIPATLERVLYRTATTDDGRSLLAAYHPVWDFEQDPRPGMGPALTRAFYTGGLKLQRVIYGKGDVEVVEMEIDLETDRVVRLYYETADYDQAGNVIHVDVNLADEKIPDVERLRFEVVSWNHMLDLMGPGEDRDGRVYDLDPEPFTEKLWKEYRMTKKVRTPLSMDRRHPEWEDGETCPFPQTAAP